MTMSKSERKAFGAGQRHERLYRILGELGSSTVSLQLEVRQHLNYLFDKRKPKKKAATNGQR